MFHGARLRSTGHVTNKRAKMLIALQTLKIAIRFDCRF